MNKDTRDLLIRLALYAGVGYGAYLLYQSIKDKLGAIGEGIGDSLYNLTHEDFVVANFNQGVRMPDGQIMDIVKSTVNEAGVFPKTGKLYLLKQNSARNLIAVQAPVGTQYLYSDMLVVATDSGVNTYPR
jgi:hypothetical protein